MKNNIPRLTKEERETLYHFDEISNEWTAESSIPKHIRKLEKQGWTKTGEQLYGDGTVMSASFKAPQNCLSPRKYDPNRPKRTISPEHREKLHPSSKRLH